MANNFKIWCEEQLSRILQSPSVDEFIRYLMVIQDRNDLVLYLDSILNRKNPEHQKFKQDFFTRWQTRGSSSGDFLVYKKAEINDTILQTSKNKKGKSKLDKNEKLNEKISKTEKSSAGFAINEQSVPAKNEKEINRADETDKSLKETDSEKVQTGVKKKAQFVPLFTKEGMNKCVVQLPGRVSCECQAMKHQLVNNCTNCGRVVCEQEGVGPCFFCGYLVCTVAQKTIIDQGNKEAHNLYKHLMSGAELKLSPADTSESTGKGNKNKLTKSDKKQDLEKAIMMKNRLLEFDQTCVKRTKVIDDQSDYFSVDGNRWLTKQQREKIKKQEEKIKSALNESRSSMKITLDFAGRKVLEERPTVNYEMNEDELIDDIQKFNIDDNIIEFVSELKYDSTVSNHVKTSNLKNKKQNLNLFDKRMIIQDAELQEMSDNGLCLSLHQPYASLLVKGIKKHEGRTWYVNHRGPLWIASAAKEPSVQEIKEVEIIVKQNFVSETVVFPERYPVGALLGCVNVIDCLPQEQYREQYPDGESNSPYVVICENFKELPIKFPIRGQHKIYKLEPSIHQSAKKALVNKKITMNS